MTASAKKTATPDHWPVIVLSLTSSTDRRKKIKKQLNNLDIPFQFFDAIDGRNGLTANDEAKVDRAGTLEAFKRPMVNAEYACALSHQAIYKFILDNDLPGAVILEDDAIVGEAFAQFVNEKAYEKAAFIQLDHWHGATWKWSRPTRLFADIQMYKTANNASLATGYCLSKSAAAFLRVNSFPIRLPADWPCDITRIDAWLVMPQIVDHPPMMASESTMGDSRDIVNARYPAKRLRGPKRFLFRSYWREWWHKKRITYLS